jgi:hypothetical protein
LPTINVASRLRGAPRPSVPSTTKVREFSNYSAVRSNIRSSMALLYLLVPPVISNLRASAPAKGRIWQDEVLRVGFENRGRKLIPSVAARQS